MRKNRKGFTLIEIIVVVTIMGILLGIMVPGVLNYISDAKAKECAANRKTLLLELDAKRVLEPGAPMQDIIDSKQDEIKCPEGGTYTSTDSENGVMCSIHGEDSLFSGNDSENFTDVAGLDTEVSEEADGKETTEPGKPDQPDKINPDDVIAAGDLKLSRWHENKYMGTQTQRGYIYWAEQNDSRDSRVLCVGINPGWWDGYNGDADFTNGDLARINIDIIYSLNDFGTADENGNYSCFKAIMPGSVFLDEKTGKYYICCTDQKGNVLDKTDFSNPAHWTAVDFKESYY